MDSTKLNDKDLRADYQKNKTLFDYLLNRAKSDFARQVRERKLRGRVFFDGRIKSFERFRDKLLKTDAYNPDEDLRNNLRENPDLVRDIVGIRFLCIDEHAAKEVLAFLYDINYMAIVETEAKLSVLSRSPYNIFHEFVRQHIENTQYVDIPEVLHRDDPPEISSISDGEFDKDRYEDMKLYARYVTFPREDEIAGSSCCEKKAGRSARSITISIVPGDPMPINYGRTSAGWNATSRPRWSLRSRS